MTYQKRIYDIGMRVEVPLGVGPGELKAYIKEALAAWGGQLHPYEDELFVGVSIRRYKARRGEVVLRRKEHA